MLRWTECSGVFQNGYLSFPASEGGRRFSSSLCCDSLVELPEVPQKVGVLPCDWAPWGFKLSDLSTLHPQQFSYSSGFPALLLISVEASAHGFLLQQILIFCICLYVSPLLGVAFSPHGLNSLTDVRKVRCVFFSQLVQLSTYR